MSADLWNMFHDGSIVSIDGSVPGDVRLFVDIPYVREMLPGTGQGFEVVITDCTRLSFAQWDRPAITDLRAMARLAPQILSAEAKDCIEVACAEGMLVLQYGAASVFIDGQQPISMEDLGHACEGYWDAWSKDADDRSTEPAA